MLAAFLARFGRASSVIESSRICQSKNEGGPLRTADKSLRE
jgi:hypothetical protein